LAELYDLLRAEGFAIGVDDHVRIGRLLARDAEWTPELLRTAVAALVVTDPGERDGFDACWARWMGGELARTVAPVARAAPAPPRRVGEPLAGNGSSQQFAGKGSGSSQQPGGNGSGSSPQHAGSASGSGPQPIGHVSDSAGTGLRPGGTASGSAGAGLQPRG